MARGVIARRVARSGIVSAAIVLVAASTARAQDKTFYLDRLVVGGAPDDAIGLWRPEQREGTRFYGQLGMGFGARPLRVDNHIEDEADAAAVDEAGGAPVTTQLVGYADVGIQALERLTFGVEVPVVAAQTGNPTSAPEANANSRVDLKPAAMMDLRLDARVLLLRPDRAPTTRPRLKLGANATAWLPTGNEYSFAGDRTAHGGFGLAGELDFGSVAVVLNTGIHLRPLASVNDLTVSSEWRWGAGAFVPLRDGALRVGAQVFGGTGIADGTFFDGDVTPLEWMAEARLATDSARRGWVGAGAGTRLTAGFSPDVRVVAVAGYTFGVADVAPLSPPRRFGRYVDHGADTDEDGLPDDVDLCPNDPEDRKPPSPDDGCPALADRDEDGIPDISDECPDEPEDFDGIRDRDGCPEDDGDVDGVPDAIDACPKTAGKPSPEPSRNGCPRFLEEGPDRLRLLRNVEFATGTARLLPESYPILDEVVDVVKSNPDIERLSVEGHTDNRGSDELNERLSYDRAKAVLEYLIAHGLARETLTAKGFGPREPIATNDTPAGRKKNRRVEFKVRTRPSP